MAEPREDIVFACQGDSRISFEWGLGRELLLAEASTTDAEETSENVIGTVQWCASGTP